MRNLFRRAAPAVAVAAAGFLVAAGVPGGAAEAAAAQEAGLPAHAASTGWASTATRAVPLANATDLGARPADSPLEVTVGLGLRNQSALQQFIAASTKPGSPSSGQTLTPAQFRSGYAPTADSVQAVENYLSSEGFTSVQVSSNNLQVTATGTVGQAQRAFNTAIHNFSQNGREVYANVAPAQVPASLSGTVVAVLGLNNALKASAAPMTTASAKQQAGDGLPNYPYSYTPQGFQHAYDAAGTPAGDKTPIAIIAEGDLTQTVKDLRTEEAANQLPQVPLTIVQTGTASSDTAGTPEWNMDTQFSTGMAQNVSHLYLYDGASLTDSDLAREFNAFAAQDLAKAGSASLGECEAFPYLDGSMVVDDEAFAEAASQGQAMFASSGDTGGSCAIAGTNGVPGSGPPFVNYPAASPYVVGVGGTTLTTSSADGAYDNELSWYAGGGGISQLETAPSWQQQVIPATANDPLGGRGVPDVAMDADPFSGATVYIDGQPQQGYGGTSLSSPLALGVWARIESAYGNNLGFASSPFYQVYLHGTCTAGSGAVLQICSTPAFHAPAAGDNVPYPETPGYNYDTGLGTFDVAQMINQIKPFVP